jgi:hypothetical protein
VKGWVQPTLKHHFEHSQQYLIVGRIVLIHKERIGLFILVGKGSKPAKEMHPRTSPILATPQRLHQPINMVLLGRQLDQLEDLFGTEVQAGRHVVGLDSFGLQGVHLTAEVVEGQVLVVGGLD